MSRPAARNARQWSRCLVLLAGYIFIDRITKLDRYELNIDSLGQAFTVRLLFELDALSDLQLFNVVSNSVDVHKDISSAVISPDETVSFIYVEMLHRSCWHLIIVLYLKLIGGGEHRPHTAARRSRYIRG
jgi:hypothetical protein